MKKRTIIASVAAGSIVVVAAAFAVQNADSGNPHLEIRRQTVVGNELRLLVETSRSYYDSPMSHSSKTADVKGYLITVDLASTKPPQERSHVYGPLWNVPNPRSSISFEAGANFTKEDRDAAAATPYCVFDVDGTLLRIVPDASRKVMVRDALVVSPAGATWKRLGDWKHIDDDLGPMSEDRLETPSGKFKLIYKDGKASLYDAFTGESKEDDWVTTAFAQVRSIKDFGNVGHFLTDDRKYLVACPEPIWNRLPQRPIVKTFEIKGKTYDRATNGLIYSRPDTTAQVYNRKYDGEGSLAETPREIYSINGDLYFLQTDKFSLSLSWPDKTYEKRFDAKGNKQWRLPYCLGVQHVPETDEVVFFDTNDFGTRDLPDAEPNEYISILRWNYRDNTTKRVDTRIWDLFNQRGGRLTPKATLPAK